MVFAHAELFRMACPHARKISQNMLLEPPKPSPDPPRTLQNRAWSAPRCYKSGQDAPKVPKKGIRSAQERENGVQERKMSQHGPNIEPDPPSDTLGFWRVWPPLRMSKQGIRRHKMQWDLTRLAQQAARRTWRPRWPTWRPRWPTRCQTDLQNCISNPYTIYSTSGV